MGIVMRPGGCPKDCDNLGARDTWLFYDRFSTSAPFRMFYDGSGPEGWLASLAVTADPTLRDWKKLGSARLHSVMYTYQDPKIYN